MSRRLRIIIAVSSLAAASLLSACIFRIEIEFHGWEGLLWLGYFHQAIPIGIALFCTWLALFAEIHPLPKRLVFTLAAALYAALLCIPVRFALVGHFGRYMFPPDPWTAYINYYAIFPFFPAIPLGFAGLARLFGQPIRWRNLAASIALFIAAAPLTMVVRPLFDNAGYNDAIHTIKSGCIIPFLMFSLGILFLSRPPQPKPGTCPKCSYDLRAHKPGDRCPECGHPILSTTNEALRAAKLSSIPHTP